MIVLVAGSALTFGLLETIAGIWAIGFAGIGVIMAYETLEKHA